MKFFYTSLILVITIIYISAQELLPYQFSIEQGEYVELENPISLTNGEIWDDPTFTVPLGFDFDYLGQTVSTLSANDNFTGGMLLVGIGNSEGINMIIPYFSDVIDKGYGTTKSESEISYEITGDSPARIAKIEWKNCGFYDEVINFQNTSSVNFQLWIYEESNIIDVVFGPSDVNTKIAHELGGATIGMAQNINFGTEIVEAFWNLHGNPFDPEIDEVIGTNFNFEPQVLIGDPPSGMIYRFTPNVVSSTQKLEKLESVKVYPTLVEEQFIIENNSAAKVNAQVFNSLGMKIKEIDLGVGSQSINCSNFEAGMYYINMSQGDKVANQKIIKL